MRGYLPIYVYYLTLKINGQQGVVEFMLHDVSVFRDKFLMHDDKCYYIHLN